ncbi:undecaprenyldiphospho-muramoylpentapeptide beta-N-acetylglucosaminyltransferase [Oceanirhabdus seepicola]|uniref:UDP-N-acetylglucosamine--N-acetylmuramyl-(pentapeptide) pyrophosphoryl-undecaprenol N-acetylglucosamine transferase n=1 Tax=Oceanirhabdus seepicola TaxID=2828781 RepID=A0A9J6P1S1_9CLOT|nr:undecaprenyldiphospho-muramoylpentapeptide beta-N-acetylglucosaminyltransferase [Oceanirhabdus seepicola]MCM1990340.1 undecaprenyldiphospho-muramoylpentapeptide beta-N-acetylglucosaminyltransferase [Oceanirhabdus seepicola]
MKKIILTGGGTSGHVNPNIALIPELKNLNYEVHYVGTEEGIEKKLIKEINIPFHSISVGKLRRYFSIKNFTDVFKTILGIFKSLHIVRKIKPNVLFSKGSYVSFPVVIACWIYRVPVIIHDSDICIGVANKVVFPFAKKICYSFPEASEKIPKSKRIFTGVPIRESIKNGSADKGFEICNFSKEKPVILVMGGSVGSRLINSAIRDNLPELLENYQICHLCGKNKLDKELSNIDGYVQYEYVNEELAHFYKMADIIVTRAGATVANELLVLNKPSLLIPMEARFTRDDQILNAQSLKKNGYSEVLLEKDMSNERICKEIDDLYSNREKYISNIKSRNSINAVKAITDLIEAYSKK